MLFVIRFTDYQDKKAVRDENLSTHIFWLAARKDSILVAGSLRHTENENPVGSIWVVEAGSKQEAEQLYRTDPFWIAGLREHVEVLHWSKAFPEERVLV